MKRYLALVALLTLPLFLTQYAPRTTQAAPAWRDTAVPAPTCLDPVQPHVGYTAVARGTVAADWDTGAVSFVSPHQVSSCGPDGWLYAGDPYQSDPLWRFRQGDPAGQQIA